MILQPPRSTRTDTHFPYTALFRSTELCVHLPDCGGAGSGFYPSLLRSERPAIMALPAWQWLSSIFFGTSVKAARAGFAVVVDRQDDADAGHDRQHRRSAIGKERQRDADDGR